MVLSSSRLVVSIVLYLTYLAPTISWTQWNYYTQWADSDPSKQLASMLGFYLTWGQNTSVGSTPRPPAVGIVKDQNNNPSPGSDFKPDQNAPRPRRGHSLVSLLTSTKSLAYKGYTYLFMFGGRDNDNATFVHVPRTYSVQTINGTVQFVTYDEKPVDPCNDVLNPQTGKYAYYTVDEVNKANCGAPGERAVITVGIFYNDVWAYRMCTRKNEPYQSRGGSTPDYTIKPGVPPEPLDPGATDARYFDSPCVETGWVSINPGASEGGCVIQLGILVCTHPSERYNHGTAMFGDGLMYVYGGFSQRCADYCDDLWVFDVYQNAWRQVYCSLASGGGCASDLSHMSLDSMLGGGIYDYQNSPLKEVPEISGPLDSSKKPWPWAGPGARWKQSMIEGDVYNCTSQIATGRGIIWPEEDTSIPLCSSRNLLAGQACKQALYSPSGLCQDMAIFGGHRLWQGFDTPNSETNQWEDYTLRPPGGYLSDLWIYTKFIDTATTAGQGFHSSFGHWRKVSVKEQEKFVGDRNNWNFRDAVETFSVWPNERAGAGLAIDTPRQLIWMHGGYATYMPYPSTDGPGSGPGPTALGIGGFIPYPGYPHFKDDLWQFNLTSGLWKQIEFPPGAAVPAGRVDHVFLLLGEVLFLHGGFGDNHYFDDTWYYNISTSRWLQKERLVYPIYPASCTDDVKFVANHPECIKNNFPKYLERQQTVPFNIIPYIPGGQEYYWPDQRHGPYFLPFQKGTLPEKIVFESPGINTDIPGPYGPPANTLGWSPRAANKQQITLDVAQVYSASSENNPASGIYIPPIGTPEAPYSAIGPMESVRPFQYYINSTNVATLYESCTSVWAEPTRGRTNLDGLYGRANFSVFVPQPRRQRPGWDGCRDRPDSRTDLPLVLSYQKPTPRAGHRAIYYKATHEIIMYGGMAYLEEQPINDTYSYETKVMDDMWYFNIYHCANNCSNHGACYYGFCKCYVGYWGEDCSNTSCPGTSCYYDPYTHDQNCLHACQAGYNHTDKDVYVQDIAKIPCNPDPNSKNPMPGESNGVCDGFGTVQCAPPFLGNDCGTKDCMSNCSFNGWCSIEYPVSRCMCQPGYFGDVCQHKLCLNNCSYPNGICNTTTGYCMCHHTYSPFNNTRPYKPWEGEDCNWLWAYAAGSSLRLSLGHLYITAVIVILSTGFLFSEERFFA